ncbi:Polysaccharide export protein [Sphingomonas paucimobilis]|nr:Polysaccharide export protein [Sphingomonas paucimobilis]
MCATRTSIAAIMFATMSIAGCASTAPPLPPEAASAQNQEYRLALGDKLRVNAYGEPSLSGEYQVSGSGVITMPLIGDVPAVGLTARELQAALVARYGAGYLASPRITVDVYDFRPYYILGEVQKPGSYPSVAGMTVLNAIAAAGGFTYRANSKTFFLRRAGETQEYSVHASSNVVLKPGDSLRVGERYF